MGIMTNIHNISQPVFIKTANFYFNFFKFFSTARWLPIPAANNNNNIVPVKIYSNASSQKANILNKNKGKSGVYKWINNKNGKTYIGSFTELLI